MPLPARRRVQTSKARSFTSAVAKGLVRVIVYNTGDIRLVCHLPQFWPHEATVHIGYTECIFYSSDPLDKADDFVICATNPITAMEIVPYLRVPYGLV